MIKPASCWEAVKSPFGAYCAFNMEYPQPAKTFLIFFQFNVLGLIDNQAICNLATHVKRALDKP